VSPVLSRLYAPCYESSGEEGVDTEAGKQESISLYGVPPRYASESYILNICETAISASPLVQETADTATLTIFLYH
jgi:hypothetical protein